MQKKTSLLRLRKEEVCCLQAVPTWVTETFVAGAHAAARAMGTWAEGTEVNELGTDGPREARATAAGKVHSICVAGAIVLAR